MAKLETLGAKEIRDQFLKDFKKDKEGEKKSSDKIRFTFTIGSEEEAIKCYNYFIDRNTK